MNGEKSRICYGPTVARLQTVEDQKKGNFEQCMKGKGNYSTNKICKTI